MIVPCGISHLGVTSLERETGTTLSLEAVTEVVEQEFRAVFDQGSEDGS